MSGSILTVSIGNTRTQVGLFVDAKPVAVERVDNADAAAIGAALTKLAGCDEACDDTIAFVASVNDPLTESVVAMAADATGHAAMLVERDVAVPIGRQLDPEAIVGVDRLLNAAGAFDTIKAACVVVDAGTAVTVDFVDGEGTFQGGAILPGTQMMLAALHEHTAALPEVAFVKPDEAIGHNTAQAMLDGAYHGVRGAVRELVEKYAELYQGYPQIIATGGDAHTLFDDYDLIENIVDDLTLRGLAVTHRVAMSDDA